MDLDVAVQQFYNAFQWDVTHLENEGIDGDHILQKAGLTYTSLMLELFDDNRAAKRSEKSYFHQPVVPYPRLSLLSASEMDRFLTLEDRFKMVNSISEVQKNVWGAYREYKTLQRKVLAEQEEYQQYLSQAACQLIAEYNYLDVSAREWVKECMHILAQALQRYKRYYVLLHNFDINVLPFKNDLLPIHIDGMLCNLGSLKPLKVRKPPEILTEDFFEFKKAKAKNPEGNEKKWKKSVISEDENARKLALAWGADVVISMGSLHTLADNFGNFPKNWEIPIMVRNCRDQNGKKRKLTFIDKTLPPKSLTPREKNASYFKELLKSAMGVDVSLDKFQSQHEVTSIELSDHESHPAGLDTKDSNISRPDQGVSKSDKGGISLFKQAEDSPDEFSSSSSETHKNEDEQKQEEKNSLKRTSEGCAEEKDGLQPVSDGSQADESTLVMDVPDESESSDEKKILKERNKKRSFHAASNLGIGRETDSIEKEEKGLLGPAESAKQPMSSKKIDIWKSGFDRPFFNKSKKTDTSLFFGNAGTFQPYGEKASKKSTETVKETKTLQGASTPFQLSFDSAALPVEDGEDDSQEQSPANRTKEIKARSRKRKSSEKLFLPEVKLEEGASQPRRSRRNLNKSGKFSDSASSDGFMSEATLSSNIRSRKKKSKTNTAASGLNEENLSKFTLYTVNVNMSKSAHNKSEKESDNTPTYPTAQDSGGNKEDVARMISREDSDRKNAASREKKRDEDEAPESLTSDLLSQIIGDEKNGKSSKKSAKGKRSLAAESEALQSVRSQSKFKDDNIKLLEPEEDENVTYALWKFGKKQALIRYSLHGALHDPTSYSRPHGNGISLQTKLEYQSACAFEQVTLGEICHNWFTMHIKHRGTKIVRGRINPHRRTLLDIEWVNKEEITKKANLLGFNPSVPSKLLTTIFDKLCNLDQGMYICTHRAGQSKVMVRQAVDDPSKKVVYDLHGEYKCPGRDVVYLGSVPWVPADPKKAPLFRGSGKRIPLMFNPCAEPKSEPPAPTPGNKSGARRKNSEKSKKRKKKQSN